jgi:glycosyltransferase involved in cell wall biosynthesis
MKFKVSILVPSYNAAMWLEETIQSVLNQTYPYWELILIDDGSADRSVEIAKMFEAKDERIQVFQQANKGACVARNKAFELSQGDYIQYLDADDLLSKNKIESQLNLLKDSDDSNAIANCSWEKFYKQKGDGEWKKQVIDQSYDSPIRWLIDSWSLKEHGQTSCWLTPRHIIENAGKWNESLKVNQDGEFFCRVLLKASQIKYTESVKVYYRMGNPNSISQSKKGLIVLSSFLSSLLLYEKHMEPFLEDEKVVEGLLSKYFLFLYRFDRYYPTLSSQVWQRIEILGKNKFQKVARKQNHPSINLVGFENYLRLVKLKTKFINRNE